MSRGIGKMLKSPRGVYLGPIDEIGGEAEKDDCAGEGTLELGKWECVMWAGQEALSLHLFFSICALYSSILWF